MINPVVYFISYNFFKNIFFNRKHSFHEICEIPKKVPSSCPPLRSRDFQHVFFLICPKVKNCVPFFYTTSWSIPDNTYDLDGQPYKLCDVILDSLQTGITRPLYRKCSSYPKVRQQGESVEESATHLGSKLLNQTRRLAGSCVHRSEKCVDTHPKPVIVYVLMTYWFFLDWFNDQEGRLLLPM